jgi:hypothetical protein
MKMLISPETPCLVAYERATPTTPATNTEITVPMMARMNMAGIDAMTSLTRNTTIAQKGILTSMMLTWLGALLSMAFSPLFADSALYRLIYGDTDRTLVLARTAFVPDFTRSRQVSRWREFSLQPDHQLTERGRLDQIRNLLL